MASDEEPDIEEPVAVEEQLKPENVKPTKLNKNGRPRKQLSEEALVKLAKAREKASALQKKQTLERLEKKMEKLTNETKGVIPPSPKSVSVDKVADTADKEVEEEEEEEEVVKEKKEKPKPKPKNKKKTKIIVEQSSSDSDEFEQNDHVVFVKRVSRKKKEVVPVVEQPQVIEQPQVMERPQPQPPIRPQLTPQQAMFKNQYDSMFSGGFLKKYY